MNRDNPRSAQSRLWLTMTMVLLMKEWDCPVFGDKHCSDGRVGGKCIRNSDRNFLPALQSIIKGL